MAPFDVIVRSWVGAHESVSLIRSLVISVRIMTELHNKETSINCEDILSLFAWSSTILAQSFIFPQISVVHAHNPPFNIFVADSDSELFGGVNVEVVGVFLPEEICVGDVGTQDVVVFGD